MEKMEYFSGKKCFFNCFYHQGACDKDLQISKIEQPQKNQKTSHYENQHQNPNSKLLSNLNENEKEKLQKTCFIFQNKKPFLVAKKSEKSRKRKQRLPSKLLKNIK